LMQLPIHEFYHSMRLLRPKRYSSSSCNMIMITSDTCCLWTAVYSFPASFWQIDTQTVTMHSALWEVLVYEREKKLLRILVWLQRWWRRHLATRAQQLHMVFAAGYLQPHPEVYAMQGQAWKAHHQETLLACALERSDMPQQCVPGTIPSAFPCGFADGKCDSSAVPGSIFCNQHKCQCGGGKRAQAVCCDVCMHRPPLGPEELISARQDPELPVTIFAEQMCTYRSPQTGASCLKKKVEGHTYCVQHLCPCGNAKRSQQRYCPRCGGGAGPGGRPAASGPPGGSRSPITKTANLLKNLFK
jgi:hypothetical protein